MGLSGRHFPRVKEQLPSVYLTYNEWSLNTKKVSPVSPKELYKQWINDTIDLQIALTSVRVHKRDPMSTKASWSVPADLPKNLLQSQFYHNKSIMLLFAAAFEWKHTGSLLPAVIKYECDPGRNIGFYPKCLNDKHRCEYEVDPTRYRSYM